MEVSQSEINAAERNLVIKNAEFKLPIYAEVDVIVCGGGVAGIAAAIASAKTGARTLLIERAGFLGGTATGSMMGLIVIPYRELSGFPKEFFHRLAEEHGAGKGEVVPWDTEAYKLTALEMVLESGADLLLYTWISEPLIQDNRVVGLVIENKSGRQVVLGKTIIDTTGDADVAAGAGIPFVKGRESDGAMRPATVMGRIGNVNLSLLKNWVEAHPDDVAQDPGRHVFDLEQGIVRIDGFFSTIEAAKKAGILAQEDPMNYLRFSAVVQPDNVEHADLIINCTRLYDVDGTNGADITRAEIEGRRQLNAAIRICREFLPGFAASYLIDTSAYLGIRETRRIKGRYTLTYEDIASQKRFADSVAVMTSVDYGTAEIHGPERGHEGSVNDPWARAMVLDLIKFEFPVGCLLPEGINNLLIAGRCASVTHDADKFTRNMGPIGLMGQAAGALGGLMALENAGNWENILVHRLRQNLRAAGIAVSL